MSAPVAAIDCGTNTIKLLIGDLPEVAVREARVVRLGQGVDRTGRLSEEALARTFAAIEEYADLIRDHGVERIRFCATSATRDAANAADFAEGVRRRLGVAPEVLSGADEAALSFAGAVRDLDPATRCPVLVVDIGGGSTELVLGDDLDALPRAAHSMDVGAVRLHERHELSDPPTAAQVAAVRTDLDAALAACPVPAAEAVTVVGVAGTVTSVAAGVLGLTGYDREATDGCVLAVDEVVALVDDVVAMTVEQRLALPWLHPGRADVIGVGGLILTRVLAHAGARELVVSESDILDGIAWSLT